MLWILFIVLNLVYLHLYLKYIIHIIYGISIILYDIYEIRYNEILGRGSNFKHEIAL